MKVDWDCESLCALFRLNWYYFDILASVLLKQLKLVSDHMPCDHCALNPVHVQIPQCHPRCCSAVNMGAF